MGRPPQAPFPNMSPREDNAIQHENYAEFCREPSYEVDYRATGHATVASCDMSCEDPDMLNAVAQAFVTAGEIGSRDVPCATVARMGASGGFSSGRCNPGMATPGSSRNPSKSPQNSPRKASPAPPGRPVSRPVVPTLPMCGPRLARSVSLPGAREGEFRYMRPDPRVVAQLRSSRGTFPVPRGRNISRSQSPSPAPVDQGI